MATPDGASVTDEAEFRRMLDAGLDTWTALREAGYETHARNVFKLRRYAVENPPPRDTASACECGCGRQIVQPSRGRRRRFYGDHRHRARNARNSSMRP